LELIARNWRERNCGNVPAAAAYKRSPNNIMISADIVDNVPQAGFEMMDYHQHKKSATAA